MKISRTPGMTLVELVIVVSIIIALVLIAISFYRGQVLKGNDAKRKSDLARITVALEEYEKDHNCYPLPQFVSCNPGTGLTPYLNKIACDPVTHATYFYEYENNSCPHWYRIYTKLDNTSDASVKGWIGPNSAFNYVSASPNAPGVTYSDNQGSTSGGETGASADFYGCKSGACVPLTWSDSRPGPECDPNYQNSSCYGQCGSPTTECVSWR